MKIKRIYEAPEPEDGYRMLIDRIWPRGVSKGEANLDEWNKDIAPSTELRKWFGHKPEFFEEFSKRYKVELRNKTEELKRIKAIAKKQNLTLLYAAKNEQINQAVVLEEVLEGIK
ncbi:DUF488 domain-containing protein [Sphingobacterium chuzhouense]|uniref:DUF488 domain-containing protein n=1 Tax=Sphingobacterium chuzhouense TaxID=1742264 RepID=A0ABR7XSJ3_9SPHI|nr:DUF488 domain-containing protein [Sphingobacterium chuzhouense]MBD1422139.1 DUF488 domain-containing protein [Sphingobacterium chuzhouense]